MKKRVILIYDIDYIDKNIFLNKKSNDDFMFCVANERINEIIEFARNNCIVLSTEEAEDFHFLDEDIVFLRVDLNKRKYKERKIFKKIQNTKLYFKQTKKYDNLEHWWKFIPPKGRRIIEFKLNEIYEKFSPNDWQREDLREVLTKPVFIKRVKKPPIGKIGSWAGNDYIDALGYSIERIGLDEELIATKLIEETFKEYRCWIYNGNKNKKVLNISRYEDFYYERNKEEEKIVENFIEEYIFKHQNINKFPPLFVIDIFLFKNGTADIVEFNNYDKSGRYVYNDIQTIIEILKNIKTQLN